MGLLGDLPNVAPEHESGNFPGQLCQISGGPMIGYSMRNVTLSFLLVALASFLSLALPLYRGRTTLQPFGEPSAVQVRNETLASINGPKIYYRLAMPVIIAGLPLLLRFRAVRIISAVWLTGWAVIGIASIGVFYLPGAITMVLAASEKPA